MQELGTPPRGIKHKLVSGINCAVYNGCGGGIFLKFRLQQHSEILALPSDLVFELSSAIERSLMHQEQSKSTESKSDKYLDPAQAKIPTFEESEIPADDKISVVTSWEWVVFKNAIAVRFIFHPQGETSLLLPNRQLIILQEFIGWIVTNKQLNDLRDFRKLSFHEMQDAIESSPGYRIFRILQSLDASKRLLNTNFTQLEKHIQKCYGPIDDPQYYAWHRRYSVQLFLEEASRLLHNYVSSCGTFVAHSRRYRSALFQNGEPPAIQERINADFTRNGLANFIQGLRAYLLHQSLSPVGLLRTISGPKIIGLFYISSKDLLNSCDWNFYATKFLSNQGDKVDVLHCIRDYQDQLGRFNSWFTTLVEKEFRSELRETEFMRQAYMYDYYEQAIQRLSARLQQSSNEKPLSAQALIHLFDEVLSEEDLHRLRQWEMDKSEWMRRAIDLVRSNHPVPKEILEQLRQLPL